MRSTHHLFLSQTTPMIRIRTTTTSAVSSSLSSSSLMFRPTMPLLMIQSEKVRNRNNIDQQNSRPNDIDIDKEQWSKQWKMASLESIMDPNIAPINLYSISGLRKKVSHWISMKKLQERRPSFEVKDLIDLFLEYKVNQNSLDANKLRLLARQTTFAEAERLSKEATTELHAKMKNSSWKTIASAAPKTQVKKPMKRDTGNDGEGNNNTNKREQQQQGQKDATSKNSNNNSNKVIIARAVGGPNMAGAPPYEIEIDSFEITNCFIGTMSTEDWIQLTVKVQYREKNASVGPYSHKSIKNASSGSGSNNNAEALRKKAMMAAVTGDAVEDSEGFTKVVEFPVFEVKLGDGVTSANTQPFSVVAVMDKDGSRQGKDGNDASMLRKQFAGAQQGWFGGAFGR